MKRLCCTLLAFSAFLLPVRAWAQPERFELGQRLRALEAAFEQATDAEARKRPVPHLKQATFAFLANRVVESAQALDKARFAIQSPKAPEPAVVWAESLWLKLDSRFLDASEKELRVTLDSFYPVNVKRPKDARLRVLLSVPVPHRERVELATVPIGQLPQEHRLPLPDLFGCNYIFEVEILSKDNILVSRGLTLSVAERVRERLEKLRKAAHTWPKEPASTDKESVRSLLQTLDELYSKKTKETDYFATTMLSEAEEAAQAIAAGKTYFGKNMRGEFWLTLAIPSGTAPVRLMAPEAVKKGQPLPLVIAMHGAGGSENIFFDAYGNGKIVRLCEERGWLLVAPRSSFARGPKLPEIIDEVARLYPVDKKRVYLVGHSMGAGQAVIAACAAPERFAGVAALGGGGAVRPSEALKTVPFFVGVGKEDFLLAQARTLHLNLEKAGVKRAELHEYADVEHLLIVQVALPEVFAFFEK